MNNFDDFDRQKAKKLLLLGILAGRIMLKSGAETYRVEDTIERILKSRKKIKYANAFATPTGIFTSVEFEEEMFTYFIRIKSIKIDLNIINLVNDFSREFVNSNMSVEEGLNKLKIIDREESYSLPIKTALGALACASLSILFGGTTPDFFASLIVGFFVVLSTSKIAKYKMTFFINNFIGATLATLLSIIIYNIGLGGNIDAIIIASIMPLVPGVAITNAMRDTISGDFISGLSRTLEAIFSALAIVFGVGLILNIHLKGIA